MASMKKQARASSTSGSEGKQPLQPKVRVQPKPRVQPQKEHICSDGVVELSVTIGYLGGDVQVSELQKLELLMQDHCTTGVVAIERGDMESHLHFQMVVRARVSSARAFGVLCRKYMDWHGVRNMNPAGKVTCKILTNRLIHTFKGMVGYCLKDSGASHFAVAMHNISDDDVVAGKTLHAIHGRADLKRRVTLTNKNVAERMYVWHKYRETRQLTATFLSTLTEMVRSGMFMPAASWIIPMSGQGMEARRMTSLWRCIVEPSTVDKDVVSDVFIRKRDFVRGCYFKDDDDSNESHLSEEGGRPLKSCLKPAADRVVRFGEDVEDVVAVKLPSQNLQFHNDLGNFIPLRNRASIVTDEFLPTSDVIEGFRQVAVKTEPEFWESISPVVEKRTRNAKGKAPMADLICLSSDEEMDLPRKRRVVRIGEK